MCVATPGDIHNALCFIETIVESSKSGDFAELVVQITSATGVWHIASALIAN
jgi:hypothetical protein